MATTRGMDRLVNFTDAVAAIAITLLILPLGDAVPEAAKQGLSAGEFLVQELPQIVAFLISFAVIARLWVAHHSLFAHLRAHNRPVLLLSLFWALTIVVLPLPTAMTSEFSPEPLLIGFYIGTMLLSSASLTALTLILRRDPALVDPAYPVPRSDVVGSATTTGAFAVAFLLGVVIPGLNYWALLTLALANPIGALLERRLHPETVASPRD